MAAPAKTGILRSYSFIGEVALLVGMAVTLLVPSSLDNILPWYEITIPLYIRSAFWITGLALLPGLYIFRLLGLLRNQDSIIKLALSSILSIVVVAVTTMIFYFFTTSLYALPIVQIVLLWALALLSWRRCGIPVFTFPERAQRSHILLLISSVATILIAVWVQTNWRYMIYTDFWTSLLPGVTMVYGRDIYSAYTIMQYPVAYGYVIAGFAAGAGVPIVNAHVLMLPLIALNVLVFYALVKMTFGLGNWVASIGAAIFAFGGGLGWIFNAVTGGKIPFITLSGYLKDMYFFPPFWDDIAFQYKLVAIVLALASFALFSLSGRYRGKEGWKGIALVALSALLFVWAFLIHMIPGLLAPVFIAIAIFNDERRLYLRRLLELVVLGVALFFLQDLMMGGIYISLIIEKLGLLFVGLSTSRAVIYASIAIGAVAAVALGYYAYLYLRVRGRRKGATEDIAVSPPARVPGRWSALAKPVILVALAAVYVAGLLLITTATISIDPDVPFPWYNYVTRYGFLGILALVGVGVSRLSSNWTRIALFWGIMSIIMGSLWWGERLNAFLFPMVSLFGAVAVVTVIKRAQPRLSGLKTNITLANIKWLLAVVSVLALVVLSFGSLFVGVLWHVNLVEQTNDNMAAAFNWMGSNIPEGDKVLADSNIHPIFFGTMALTCHSVSANDVSGWYSTPNNTTADIEAFKAENIRWVFVNDSLPALTGITEMIRGLQYYGDVAFKQGEFSLRRIPYFSAPSETGAIAIVDKEFLGVEQMKNTFGWVDDSMDRWTVNNAQEATDGEVLTISWNFTTAPQPMPIAYTSFTSTSMSAYPFLLIHYRNTPETSTSAEISVRQAVSLAKTGASSSVTFPIPVTKYYNLVAIRLPSNFVADQISLAMNNTLSLNGTVGLEIDFIGLSTSMPTFRSPSPGFLSLTVPATWPTNHTVNYDFNLSGNETVLVTTFDPKVNEKFVNLQGIQTVVLFNSVLYQPMWGTNWTSLSSGVMKGTYEGKDIIIVSADAHQIVGNLSDFSAWLYDQVS